MHFPLLEPLTPTAEPWGLEEPSLRNIGLTYFMLPESLHFTLKKTFMLFMWLYISVIETS